VCIGIELVPPNPTFLRQFRTYASRSSTTQANIGRGAAQPFGPCILTIFNVHFFVVCYAKTTFRTKSRTKPYQAVPSSVPSSVPSRTKRTSFRTKSGLVKTTSRTKPRLVPYQATPRPVPSPASSRTKCCFGQLVLGVLMTDVTCGHLSTDRATEH
jgi:hypothetical protein